jgi:glutathione S-transferase
MARGVLTVSSRNYSSWSLRGSLVCTLAGIDFEERTLPADDPSARAELLHLSPSFLVPRLEYDGVAVWGVLAIAEFVNEIAPDSGLLPKDRVTRAHCRSISGEMQQGFANLRSALPMNMRAHHPGFKIWAGARPDIDRILSIWSGCLRAYGGPFLFGPTPTLADAMFAPVCSRFSTYDVSLPGDCAGYRDRVLDMPAMQAWKEAALLEHDEIEMLDNGDF